MTLGLGALVLLCVSAYFLLHTGAVFSKRSASFADGGDGSLDVTYGSSGVQRVAWRGTVLLDAARVSDDGFRIGHMRMTDLHGAVLRGGQNDWGENNSGKAWDATSHSWTYRYTWGSIQVRFVARGNSLGIVATETNSPDSGVVLEGAVISALGLHFPSVPEGFGPAGSPHIAFNTDGPSVTVADFGGGEVAAVDEDARTPLYSGFWPGKAEGAYSVLIGSTTPDGLATFQPHFSRRVLPGGRDTFSVTLRFGEGGTPAAKIAGDVFAGWARAWPMKLNWPDRRPIGTVYLASSPSEEAHPGGGLQSNPRRYFTVGEGEPADVRSKEGLDRLQRRMLDQAEVVVQSLHKMGAQGAITWDIEGEQFPQSTSYVCAPDAIAVVAPEMESTVTDSRSAYRGMKLDDAYFKIITAAGFRAGVCVRPQRFTMNGPGSAHQAYVDDGQAEQELFRKIKYAHDRWGVTLFYVDSSVRADGSVLDASMFEQLASKFPDSLLIPEESTFKHYAYTAPFKTFLFHGDTGTAQDVYAAYPQAFSLNLINDVDAKKLGAGLPRLRESVRRGDVLMGHADYWHPNNDVIVSMHR